MNLALQLGDLLVRHGEGFFQLPICRRAHIVAQAELVGTYQKRK